MFEGFYILTKDVYGQEVAPDEWHGLVKLGTPVVMTYFDEHGMEFIADIDFTIREFRLKKPCPIVAAASCQYCGKIVITSELNDHMVKDVNCHRVRGLEG